MVQLILAVFFTSGILFRVLGSTSWVVLGITIGCGVGLSVYLVRFVWDRLSLGGVGDRANRMSEQELVLEPERREGDHRNLADRL